MNELPPPPSLLTHTVLIFRTSHHFIVLGKGGGGWREEMGVRDDPPERKAPFSGDFAATKGDDGIHCTPAPTAFLERRGLVAPTTKRATMPPFLNKGGGDVQMNVVFLVI